MKEKAAQTLRKLLSPSVRFELRNREATAEERAYLDGLGKIAVSTGLRSMARLADGSEQTLTEVKAVDGAYPLYGEFKAEPAAPLPFEITCAGALDQSIVDTSRLPRQRIGEASRRKTRSACRPTCCARVRALSSSCRFTDWLKAYRLKISAESSGFQYSGRWPLLARLAGSLSR